MKKVFIAGSRRLSSLNANVKRRIALDGESKGTLNSVINMIRQERPVVVYLAPKRTFQNLRSARDLMALLGSCDRASVQRFDRELGIEHVLNRAPLP